MKDIKILIVEDEIIVGEDIKDNLEELGYIITAIADSGEQAIQEAAITHPDLVLMDIRLKGKMDGVQASETIWNNFKIPIVYLTANSDISTIQRAKNTKPFGYVTKPFRERELHAAIEIALHRHQLEKKLKEREQWLETILTSLGDAVIATDDKSCITLLNPVAEVLTGWKQADAFGKNATEVFNIVHAQTRSEVDITIAKALQTGVVGLPEHTILVNRHNIEIPIDYSAAPIKNDEDEVKGAVIVFRDITDRKLAEEALRQSEQRLVWQASHDPLTGLANRHEFEQRLVDALLRSAMHDQTHSLCYLDLDRFKIVNDTCGHAAGDELLRQVTALLRVQVRTADTVARLGGDEFGILLNNCPIQQALRIANSLRQKLEEFRFAWQDKIFTIGLSIGVVGIDANTTDLASVLNAADVACYTAKNTGRNRVHIYQADDRLLANAYGQMQWISKLHTALENDSFCLYCQPIISLSSTESNLEHYEILLRLQDETGALVPPMAFIPAAERYGIMHLIDRWVIRTLFTHLGQHYQNIGEDGDFCIYAVNLSGASINDDQFMDFLHEQFSLHQIPPQAICFEITETIAITNLNNASKLIRELKNLGCSFALDDFGSGMSSFAYLKNLPVDYLKIDGNFVREIVEVPTDLALTEAINQIGHIMGLKTIAEFVENDAILQKITELGVDYAQGYGIARPRPFVLDV